MGVEVEGGQRFAGEPGGAKPRLGAAVVAVFAFGQERLGEEAAVGELVMVGLVGGLGEPAQMVGRPSTRQAVPVAVSAACSVMPRVRG